MLVHISVVHTRCGGVWVPSGTRVVRVSCDVRHVVRHNSPHRRHLHVGVSPAPRRTVSDNGHYKDRQVGGSVVLVCGMRHSTRLLSNQLYRA